MTDGERTPASAPGEPVEPKPQQAEAAGDGAKAPEEMSVGELVFEVSDRASVLIREEVELAKTEVTEKLNSLLRGSVAGLAGVFVLLALILSCTASPGCSTTSSSTTSGPVSSLRPGSSC